MVSDDELELYRASLHKAFGRLFTAQQRYVDAIKELSEGIYLECKQFGPETVQLCSSYFYLGSIFNKQEKKEECKSFYQKIIEIWKKHIMSELEDEADPETDEIYFDEAKEHLKNILLFFEVELGP